MEKKTKKILCSIILLIIFILFTLLVKYVDVQEIGPLGSSVGFANFNTFCNMGANMKFYALTEILGIIPLGIVCVYAIIGVIQLIKRKSLFKVDREIIMLGVFYVIVALLYLLFEKNVINYRPVLIEGMLEASYPSSHTILSIFVCASSMIVNRKLIKNEKMRKILEVLLIVLMILILLGRIISGVHWCTDIIGGCIISIALLECFDTIFTKNEKDETNL